jgi:hypothetical protein
MLTSKALLRNIAINSENGLFHLDATHSTSRVGYNLFVGGISYRRGHLYPALFHLMQLVHKKYQHHESYMVIVIGLGIMMNMVQYGINERDNIGDPLQDFCNWLDQTLYNDGMSRWQIFNSPQGFVTTNNPFEQFNKKIKQEVTNP